MSHFPAERAFQGSPRISLRQLLPCAEFLGTRDLQVQSIEADSRKVRPGDLFVALVGTRADGHEHVEEAISRGAVAVLTEQLLPGDFPQCVVEDTRIAYGTICQALAGNPSQAIKVIGITGTNGKTTTSCLVASILKVAGYQPGLLGTLGYSDGETTADSSLTTPDAPVLAEWLARMVQNECTHAVMEVSSHALAQHRVAGMQIDAVAVTNLRRDHLDYHGSLAAYREAKRRLFSYLSPEGFAVVNADDAVALGYLSTHTGPALTVSLSGNAEITATLIERSASEQIFMLEAGSDNALVRTRMIGDHHISNCLVAAAIGLTYGITLEDVVRGLEAIDHVPGRLERVECGQPFAAFVDYAHTPDALACTLKTLREVTSGKLICVFGAGGDRDRPKRSMMGRTVEQLADVAIITTDNPRTEDPEVIAREILSGCEQPAELELVCDRASAIHRALDMAQPGDTVVVCGKGHENYQIVGTKTYPFDDRETVREWLYQSNEEPASLWGRMPRLRIAG